MTVAFGTKNGSTAEVCGWIASRLRGHDCEVEPAQARTVRLKDSDRAPGLVVLGGAIDGGR